MSNRLFDITGSTGASHTYHLHPIQRVLAYESGCYIILWDLDIDKKLMIHPHDYTVTCVRFFGRDYEYLLSIDGNYRPSIFITEWQTMTRIHQMYLPVSRNNQKVLSFELTYCQRTNMLIIVANYGDHYSFSVWDFKLDNLTLIATNKEDNQETCVGVHTFDDEQDTFFAIAERNMIKYWRYYNRKLELVHKIHIKEEIVSTAVSNLTQLFLFATRQGRLCVVNKEGQFISSIKHPELTYTSLTLFSDYLFLGTKEGEIDVYQLSTLQFQRPLQGISQAVKENRNANKPENKNVNTQKLRKDHHDTTEEKSSLNKLVKISVAKSTGLLALKYADNNIFIFDMDTERVLFSVTGHSQKINNIFWNEPSKTSFITCSNDGTVRVWNFIGDRWESYPLTNSVPAQATFPVAVFQDESFQSDEISFQAQTASYKITCMQVDWANKEIFTGDNHGCLNIYDLPTGYLKYSLKVSGFKLKEISLGESFVGMAFSNQSSLVVERQGSYEAYIKLEEPRLEMGPKQKGFTGIKLIENENHVRSSRYHQSRYDNTGYQKGFDSNRSASQRAITVHNANTMRIHQVVATQGKLESAILATYNLQGKIVDYTMHVSNDYLLVLSNEDLLYVFEVNSGDIRGKIEMPRFSKKITCDPAGLYVTIASPLISPESEDIDSEKPYLTMGSTKGFSPTKDKNKNRDVNTDQSILSVFELWTGEYVGLMNRIQTANSLTYSYDGSLLAVGTSQGLVTVLSLDEGLRENIYSALEGIRQNPAFWEDFQLNMGEKKLSSEAFALLRPGENFNASRVPDQKSVITLHGISSPSKVRSPQLHTQSHQSFGAQPVQPSQKMKSPPSGKAPTMKDYVQTNKVQKSSVQQQKKKNQDQEEQPTAMLISGYDQTRNVTNNPSTVTSKIVLPNASLKAHQERAKEHAEHIRAVNFGRRDIDDERRNQIGESQQQQQQFIPKPTGPAPVDKVIDLVYGNREIEGLGRFKMGADNRKMQTDPSDIDEMSFLESYDRRRPEEKDNRRVSFFDNQTIESRNAIEEGSNMYEDINEFERKFYRDSNRNPNWH